MDRSGYLAHFVLDVLEPLATGFAVSRSFANRSITFDDGAKAEGFGSFAVLDTAPVSYCPVRDNCGGKDQ